MDCPSLGLSQVNICDGSYSKTKIYPVSGLQLEDSEDGSAIGNFTCSLLATMLPTTSQGVR